MTVSTTTNQASYSGDGAITDFSFSFSCASASDIGVFLDNAELLIGVVVTVNEDQSANPGGSVEITPAPGSGVVVDIIRSTKIDQQTDYNAYDPFPAETHELALDKLTMISQDLKSVDNPVWVEAPASSTAPGTVGQMAYDDDYMYLCVTTDNWKRITLETY